MSALSETIDAIRNIPESSGLFFQLNPKLCNWGFWNSTVTWKKKSILIQNMDCDALYAIKSRSKVPGLNFTA